MKHHGLTRLLVVLALVGSIFALRAPGMTTAAARGVHSTARSGIWTPAPGTTWYWQISCPGSQNPPCVNMNQPVQIYDIGGFDNTAATVSALHARGVKVLCYMDAGTWENWRPDAGQFPASVKGKNNGWPGEKWLDIRQASILDPIMESRALLCQSKGFDGIEWDNVDGYSNSTGFTLTPANQITYNSFLANYTHSLGLSAALKNDTGQVSALQPLFDLAVDEQCFQYAECDTETPFINAGKAVLEVEYKLATSKFCARANAMKFSAAKAGLNLDGKIWTPCW